jgi:DNA anti-recombination protein RmuC
VNSEEGVPKKVKWLKQISLSVLYTRMKLAKFTQISKFMTEMQQLMDRVSSLEDKVKHQARDLKEVTYDRDCLAEEVGYLNGRVTFRTRQLKDATDIMDEMADENIELKDQHKTDADTITGLADENEDLIMEMRQLKKKVREQEEEEVHEMDFASKKRLGKMLDNLIKKDPDGFDRDFEPEDKFSENMFSDSD